MTASSFLVSSQELSARLGDADLAVVDASWYLPAQGRNARREFETDRIPGAVFFDHDRIVDQASTLPHTLPSEEAFAEAAGRLGIAETDRIVVYDGLGLFSAPRAWWMFRTFGARDVRILDGGFPAWVAAGLTTETGSPPSRPAKSFRARFRRDAVVDMDEMRAHVAGNTMPILDARSAERFEGSAPEPRAGVRGGHMPGARSLPFTELVANDRLKSPDELRLSFARAGVDPDQPAVTSCGSGITAAVISLALESLGNDRSKLYDGSWTEWGSASDTPVETGPARPSGQR